MATIVFKEPGGQQITEPELYAFFSRIWSRCQVVFRHTGEGAYTFRTGEKEVNPMGVRGLFYALPESKDKTSGGQQELDRIASVSFNKSGVFDDCILVLRKENGVPRVHPFSASLQYGRPGSSDKGKTLEQTEEARRDLRLDMHRYRFGFHHQGKPKVDLKATATYPSNKGYRALRPYDAGAFFDENKNGLQEPTEELTSTDQHNVHAGDRSDKSSGYTWGEGCQVIKDWRQFKGFLGVMESDHTLKGVKDNEMTSPPPAGKDGTQDIIYTLIDSTFLFPCMFPLGDLRERAISFTDDRTALINGLNLLDKVAKHIHGGCFPIGRNHCWHGGLHLPSEINRGVFAPMPGEIAAFRLGSGGLGRAHATYQRDGEDITRDLGNHNFILMRHRLEEGAACLAFGKAYSDTQGHTTGGHEKEFYSLYMHLGEYEPLSPGSIEEASFPFRWLKDSYKVQEAPKTKPQAISAPSTVPDKVLPTVPKNLKAKAGSESIALTWSPATDNVGVTEYQIFRDSKLLTSTPGNVTEFTDGDLPPSTTYRYAVAARDAAGNVGNRCPAVVATTLSGNYPIPPFPAYKSITNGGDTRRSERGMIDTGSQNRVMMEPGDKFRVLQDNYLVQDNDPWSEIEKYYDGKEKKALSPPQKLYIKRRYIESTKCSVAIAEWKQKDFLAALQCGEIMLAEQSLGHPVHVNAGELLWHTGVGLGPHGIVGGFLHWSIFSTTPVFPWKQIVDDTNDSVIENRNVLDLVPQTPERKGKPLSMEEVWDFYRSEDPEVMQKAWSLGWTAVKFQTEWAGDPSIHAAHLGSMDLEEGRKLDEEAYKKSADPFAWWQAVAPRVGLPADGEVWHYNPVMFSLALGLFTESAPLAAIPPIPGIKPDKLPTADELNVKTLAVPSGV